MTLSDFPNEDAPFVVFVRDRLDLDSTYLNQGHPSLLEAESHGCPGIMFGNLTPVYLCVLMCCMKISTVTTREAQHNLAQILRRVERGETIEVLRRKAVIAHIVPARPAGMEPGKVDWSDLPSRLEKIWHGGMAPGQSTDEILADLRGER